MVVPDFNDFAAVMLKGRDYTLQVAALHQQVHRARPTKMAMAHELRSSVAAQIAAGATEFELSPQYVDFGRIAFTSAAGARFRLKSRAAMPFELPLPLEGDWIDEADDVVFLVVFDFVEGDLVLELVPAQEVRADRRRRFALLDNPTLLGVWSDTSPLLRPTGFDQDDSGSSGAWWEEDDGTGDEIEPGL
jgi:hypothetical protein